MDVFPSERHRAVFSTPAKGFRQRVFRGRKPAAFPLAVRDALLLAELLTRGLLPARAARRARILLWRAQGERIAPVAGDLRQHRATVWRVCRRYAQGGLQAALFDAPRTGRPRTSTAVSRRRSVPLERHQL